MDGGSSLRLGPESSILTTTGPSCPGRSAKITFVSERLPFDSSEALRLCRSYKSYGFYRTCSVESCGGRFLTGGVQCGYWLFSYSWLGDSLPRPASLRPRISCRCPRELWQTVRSGWGRSVTVAAELSNTETFPASPLPAVVAKMETVPAMEVTSTQFRHNTPTFGQESIASRE